MAFALESPGLLALLAALPLIFGVLRYSLAGSPLAQRLLSGVVRATVIALVVLALAGTHWLRASREPAVLVIADLSDSAPEDAPDQARAILADIEAARPAGARAGLVSIAATPEIRTPVARNPEFPEAIAPPEDRGETRLADALRLAREAMPADTVNRVLLLSDGNETAGDAREMARRLAERGIRVYTRAWDQADRPEVLLEDLAVPSEVKRGQSFRIQAVAHASAASTAAFTLYRDGFKVGEQEIAIEAGANAITFDETSAPDGLVKYELHVAAPEDHFADNNVSSGVVFVAGEPRILLLEGKEREGRHLARALEAENIRVDYREGRGMPAALEELAAFDAIIFSDVPATDVSARQMELLRSYIEDLGGGFIMIGGEESFGLGGYYRTSIEQALPVRMRSERQKDTPSIAIMLVIDKSGSMGGDKIELAKEAAIAAVELLGSRDYAGVVAFDGAPQWIVELQGAGNQTGIIQQVMQLQAGGGTHIAPALEEAANALASVPATLKHAILLTDGQSQPGDYAGIVNRMVNGQVTVSTVAVGDGADTALLQEIARWGRGRYYFTADPFDIPQIFTRETMSASKSSLVEEPFLPVVTRSAPVIQSIDWDSTPFLLGYVVCTAKPTAEVPLITERGDPLLASWRFGLGKSVAFMSDAKSRWAADWLGWPGYSRFWAQVVRDTLRDTRQQGVETRIVHRGESGRIVVDAATDAGDFVNGLHGAVQMVRPSREIETVALRQTAPGRYEAEMDTSETGSYLFKIRQTLDAAGEDVYADFTRGLTISYKPEYRHLGTNTEFLEALARDTGGSFNPAAEDLFAVSPEESVRIRRDIGAWLLAAALVLFVVDVAMRRLDLAGYRPFQRPGPRG